MKLSSHITRTIPFIVVALAVALVWPSASNAQSLSWWGSNQWFDWSDFKLALGVRYYMARLTSGTITLQGDGVNLTDVDLTGPTFAIPRDPDPFNELWGILYIDRLGLRFSVAAQDFFGQPTPRLGLLGTPLGRWEFKTDFSRAGVDLDLIRFPFLRFGIDWDYQFYGVRFLRKEKKMDSDSDNKVVYASMPPMTVGIHARVLPGRIHDIPVTAQVRLRFPIPGVNQKSQAKITDWEISGGLRPSIWETSVIAGATFSFGLEAGYRSIDLSMKGEKDNLELVDSITDFSLPPKMDLKAHWQGAFVQVELFF